MTARGLVNANDQQYINVSADDALARAVSVKSGGETPEFMKRDTVLKTVRANMQAWHEIGGEGREPVRRCVRRPRRARARALLAPLVLAVLTALP